MSDAPYATHEELDADLESYDRQWWRIAEGRERDDPRVVEAMRVHSRLIATVRRMLSAGLQDRTGSDNA